MKKFYFFTLLLFSVTMTFGQISEIYFSMYGEGSSNNKFLEIYNGTGATINLDNYAFPNVSNAPTVSGEYEFWNTFPSGATIADGDVFVIAHGSADPTILAEADMTFNFLSNGDDGFALVANDGTWDDADMDGNIDAGEMTGFTILDWLGTWQGDGPWTVAGVTNGTQNHTLTRKSSVCGPNNDWASSAGTDAATSEWIVTGIDTEWANIGSYTGCVTAPTVTISSPADASTLAAGTTSVDIVFSAENAPGGSTFDITIVTNGGSPVTTNGVTSPYTITPTSDGDSFSVTVDLVDGGILASDTTNFDIDLPCDLQIGTITETCDAITSGSTDTYSVTLEFTGGGTSTYTIDTGGVGTVGGNDPSTNATGIITITGVTENTDFVVTFTGDPLNSGCDFTRNINSPDCDPVLPLPFTDYFEHGSTAGDLTVVSAGDWEVHSGTGPVQYLPTSLVLSGYDARASFGGSVSVTSSNGEDVNKSFAVQSSGKVYMSALVNVSAVSGTSYFWHFKDDGFGYRARVGAVDDTMGGIYFGISTSGSSVTPGTTSYSLNTTYLLVVSYDIDTGVSNLYVLTAPVSTEPSTPEATSTGTSGTPISSVAFRQGGGIPDAIIDGIRVSTTWSDLTLSSESIDINKFSIFPNPTNTGFVNITSTGSEVIKAQVFDILGKQVLESNVENNQLNVSNLNAGLYMVKLTQNNASVIKKLIIK